MRKLGSIRSRARAGILIGATALGVIAVACGGHFVCVNLPLATALIGQTSYGGFFVNDSGPVSIQYSYINTSGAPTGQTLAQPSSGLVINTGVVTDASSVVYQPGTLAYLADTGNNRVLVYTHGQTAAVTPTADVQTGVPIGAADFAIGQPNLTSGAGSAKVSSTTNCSTIGLSGPDKVSISDTGTQLVVTDTGNNRVLIWNSLPTAANTPPNVVVGQMDCAHTNSNGANGTNAIAANTLSHPTAAMIANGHLVIVDQNNNRVLIYNTVPTTNGVNADVELGQDTSSGATGFTTNAFGPINPTTQIIELLSPTDLWTDGSQLFVADTGNNRVLYWNVLPEVSNTNAFGVFGQPSGFTTSNPGTSALLLSNPVGVFFAAGSLYIADTGNNRVLVFQNFQASSSQNRGVSATGVFGQQDFNHHAYNDDDQNGVNGDQQNDPNNGNSQTNLNATRNTVDSPNGVFVDASSNLWIADTGNNRILQFPTGSYVNGANINLCNGYFPLFPNGQ